MQEPQEQHSYFAGPITIAAGVGVFVSACAGYSAAVWKATQKLGRFGPTSTASSGKAWSQAVYLSRSSTIDWFRCIISGAAFACSSLSEPEHGAG
jgi:hypothetical protein